MVSLCLPAFTQSPEPGHIYNVDALTLLRAMPANSVDLVVTSPPYNLSNTVGGGGSKRGKGKWNGAIHEGYDTYRDKMPHDQYVVWQRSILAECVRVIKDNGAIFYNHKWRVQAGLLQDRADIVTGLPVRQIIIWQRDGGHNFNAGYFLPTYEVVYLIAKPEFKLAAGANAYGDVWHISQNPKHNEPDHPAPFPVEFARRCIVSTNAQLVLDPFMGRGTTGKAAQMLGRQYIGCDVSRRYCDMARRWLAQPVPLQMFEQVSDHNINTLEQKPLLAV